MKRFYAISAVAFMLTTATAEAQNTLSVLDNAQLKTNIVRPMKVSTNIKKAGEVVTLPYIETFDNEQVSTNYTIIDANEDDNTWGYSKGVMQYYYDMFNDNPGDDWLITPPLPLEAGKKYEINFKAASGLGEFTPERFEAFLGKNATVDAMKIQVFAPTVVTNDQLTPYTATVSIIESGNYHLGIHCISDADSYTLDIDDISVKEDAEASAPAAVTNLTATPDSKGELQATITFTAPTTLMNGNTLDKIKYIEILRANSVINTIDNAEPGKEYTFIDKTPSNGTNYYSIVVYNETGAGKTATATAFIGVDVPSPAHNANATCINNDVKLTWMVGTTGWNKQYVNPEKVFATIYKTPNGITRELVADNVYAQEYTIEGANNIADQTQMVYQIYLTSAAGRSQIASTNTIVIGKPYQIPFKESLSEGKTDNTYWSMDRSSSKVQVLSINESQDGDNGAFYLKSTSADDTLILYSGKIDISTATKPTLTFYTKSNANDARIIATSYKDEKEIKQFNTLNFTGNNTEWQLVEVDLTEIKDNGYIQIAFDINFGSNAADVYVDNIQVTDGKPTALNNIESEEKQIPVIYNMQGMRINSVPDKGIYIINNKKVLK